MADRLFTQEELARIKADFDSQPPEKQEAIRLYVQKLQQGQQPQQNQMGRLGSAALSGLQAGFGALGQVAAQGGAGGTGQITGYVPPKKDKASELDELIKLEKFKTQQQIDAFKIKEAEFKAKEMEGKSALGKKVEAQPSITDQGLTVGGGTTPTSTPDTVTPDTKTPVPTPQVDTTDVFSKLPIGDTPDQTVEGQLTGFPKIDTLVKEVGNIPLMLNSAKETVDTDGKISRTKSVSVNPIITKYIENKLARTGKINEMELKILEKGRQEDGVNTRNTEAILGLEQVGVSVWKAAKAEKEGIPIIFGSSVLKAATGPVAEALHLKGFSWSKAYMGQRIEQAMALSKIITGGARVIKSVISQLMKTLPEDDGIIEDMESKTFQSAMNSITRATGRPLTEEEKVEASKRIRGILDTAPAQIPESDMIDAINAIPTSKRIEVNGVVYDIPIEDFVSALDEFEDDDVITILD